MYCMDSWSDQKPEVYQPSTSRAIAAQLDTTECFCRRIERAGRCRPTGSFIRFHVSQSWYGVRHVHITSLNDFGGAVHRPIHAHLNEGQDRKNDRDGDERI